jgi:MYXO-CTERM domain-containing protein
MLRLAERFDGGVPSRETENYYLVLIGRVPIFIPPGALWGFGAFALLLALAAFFSVRRRRRPSDDPAKVRWSGFKMTLYTFVVVCCGWFSSDFIGLIRGVRFPWFVSINCFRPGGIGVAPRHLARAAVE